MKNLWVVTSTVILISTAGLGIAQPEKSSDLRSVMTEEQFKESGLYKLSPEELKKLQEWVDVKSPVKSSFSVAPEPAVIEPKVRQSQSAEDRFGLFEKKEKEKPIEVVRTRIPGTFKGWKGGTVFELENGQVWKQRISGRWSGRLENPEVEIYQTKLGFFNMRILSNGKKIGVKRVK